MNSPEEIMKIADSRLEEAKILLDKGKYNGAFYLAGYSVELYLKAKICINFGVPDLFSKKKTNKTRGEIRSAVFTHNLLALLIYSGLITKYEKYKKDNPKMGVTIHFIFSQWNEEERYRSDTSIQPKQIIKIINNLEEFLLWMKQN